MHDNKKHCKNRGLEDSQSGILKNHAIINDVTGNKWRKVTSVKAQIAKTW